MRIPTATYRLQFNADFDFTKAGELLDYLNTLGVSDIYASPIFRARAGSAHGYDVVDMNRLNPELGGETGFDALRRAVEEHDMGWIQDLVPNHMAYDFENQWLTDVLKFGPSSSFIDFFDIDLNHPDPNLNEKVMAPFLGSHYAEALENGDLKLRIDSGGIAVTYYDQIFPLSLETEIEVLGEIFAAIGESIPAELLDKHRNTLKAPGRTNETMAIDNQRIFKELDDIGRRNPLVSEAIDNFFQTFGPHHPDGTYRMERLLSRQYYQLSFWRSATGQINYRRFFDINHLITLRMHDPDVFAASHKLILSHIRNGDFTGIRIDHVDGLRDPKAYLDRLRKNTPECLILVEKILAEDEQLPDDWPVNGTTGYEFATKTANLFCRPEAGAAFSELYGRFAEEHRGFDNFVEEGKKRCMNKQLSGDIDNLVRRLAKIAAKTRFGADVPFSRLRMATEALLGAFPVYRTYVDASGRRPEDDRIFSAALERARRAHADLSFELELIHKIWTAIPERTMGETAREADELQDLRLDWVMGFQQLTAPLTAKGLEDTALYNYNRFAALNEVGGAPDTFGLPADRFYAFCRERLKNWPDALNATATHDTKRGEDVRARLWVLSEIPDEWEESVLQWQEENIGLKPFVKGSRVPDANFEYLLYQTILGAFPFDPQQRPTFLKRIQDYAVKAAREAKAHTNWEEPDTGYENGCCKFLERLLDSGQTAGQEAESGFLPLFFPFFGRVVHFGIFNSLAQVLIKMTAPGIPDIYQGTELFDLNLVDPDNRRPVDYGFRWNTLKYMDDKDKKSLTEELLEAKTDGRIKLYVTAEALRTRKKHPDLFRTGEIIPLETTGRHAHNILTFARRRGPSWSITAVPRFLTTIIKTGTDPVGKNVWQDTAVILPDNAPSNWENAFTGEILSAEKKIDAASLMGRFPVCLLTGESLS